MLLFLCISKRGTGSSDMDAHLWHFLGSQMVELKARPFSYWRCVLVDLAKSVFRIVHFLATRGHLFSHNSGVCRPNLMKFTV